MRIVANSAGGGYGLTTLYQPLRWRIRIAGGVLGQVYRLGKGWRAPAAVPVVLERVQVF